MRRALAILALVFLPLGLRAEPVTVFAAASLKPVLDVVLPKLPMETRAVYAGSSALARQIEAGAPADVFLSASTDWMDHLEAKGLLAPGSRRDIAGNRLVLVGPAEASPLEADGLAAIADARIAVALTDAVPAGVYARAALTHLGLWDTLRPSLVEAQDVRAALRLALTGAASYAIVYASDAVSEPGVRTLFVFPEDSHPPIVYPGAVVAGAAPGAAALLDDITAARPAFEAAGFQPPGAE